MFDSEAVSRIQTIPGDRLDSRSKDPGEDNLTAVDSSIAVDDLKTVFVREGVETVEIPVGARCYRSRISLGHAEKLTSSMVRHAVRWV